MTMSRAIHIQKPIPKHYQIMVSSMARLNLLKTRSVLGIIPKASQNKFHQSRITKSKVIHVQISVPKWEKQIKWEKIFWATKLGSKGITNRSRCKGL